MYKGDKNSISKICKDIRQSMLCSARQEASSGTRTKEVPTNNQCPNMCEKKKEIWLSPMTKALHPQKNPKATWQHKNGTKNFGYTIAERLRMVSWSNDSHPTCVVKLVYGIPTFPLTAKAALSKGHAYKNL